ncbi:MAG: hypothetical protein U9N49_00835 [Campylobacterota bacterium]|nr:hypothetical protein [Campylobacterota bacterium]
MNTLEKVITECYWDYNISIDELEAIIHSGDKEAKKRVFEKIIYNSSDRLQVLKELFSLSELREFLAKFKPTYNQKYINRKVLLIKNILLGEKNTIEALEWKKR